VHQGEIEAWLRKLARDGRVSPECPVKTSKGTKVADVAWAGPAFLKKHGIKKVELPESPEVVVEIESPSKSAAELEEKRLLYFEKGAREFWLCDEEGHMRFFNPRGELARSEIFGGFPGRIEIDIA
jgi:Uma2 family endonuclease